MPLDPRIRKALLRNRNQMKSTRVNQAYKFAKEHDIQGVTKKAIMAYIKDIEATKKFDGKKASKKFVFNFIGGWFADIGFNRNKEMGRKIDGDDWLKQFVLFVNGNTGWAKVYEAPTKDRTVVSSIIERFIKDMKGYPVKQIITDNDGCFDDTKFPIMKIQSEIADNEYEEHKNHRLFSRIDSFMSHLRRYAWHEYNVGKVNGKHAKITDQPPTKEFYIPLDTVKRFVMEWNEHSIPQIRCTRNEMMRDRNLEMAYICYALYGNKLADKLRSEIQGEVQLKTRVRFNDLGANRQERASGVRAGRYVIRGTKEGHYVGVDRDGREVHFNADEIANTIDDFPAMTEENELANVADEINNDAMWENMVSRYNGPAVEEPKEPKRIEVRPKEKEPPLEDVAQELAHEEQEQDLQRGIPPDMAPDKIYESAKKWLAALKKVDMVSYSDLIDEAVSKRKKVTNETARRVAQQWNIQAATGTPYYQQYIPIDNAYKAGRIMKQRNQLRQRNGRRANTAKNNSTRKSATRQYGQHVN